MGAWGAGSFENDSALDALTLLAQDWTALLQSKLHSGLNADYLEVDQASEMLVVLEVIAAACGRPSEHLPDGFPIFKGSGTEVPEHLKPLLERALARVREDSELAGLWSDEGEGPEFEAWLAALTDLERRLLRPG